MPVLRFGTQVDPIMGLNAPLIMMITCRNAVKSKGHLGMGIGFT
jgi:hypothetical protein